MVATTSENKHRMGVRGQYGLSSSLKEAARKIGFSIVQRGNRYALEHMTGIEVNPQTLYPDFIRHVDGTLDLENLEALLSFFHQPLRVGVNHVEDHHNRMVVESEQTIVNLQNYMNGDSGLPVVFDSEQTPYVLEKELKAQQEKQRNTAHRTMRFLTTGSVIITPGADEEDEEEENNAEPECHADAEETITTADLWRREPELANSKDVRSSIPNTVFAPAHGYGFMLHEYLFEDQSEKGSGTEALRKEIRSFLDGIKPGILDHVQPGQTIYLTSQELSQFCALFVDYPEFDNVLEQAKADELVYVNEKIADFKAQALKEDVETLNLDVFGKNRTFASETEDTTKQLKRLLLGTTCLTQLMAHPLLQQAWKDFNWTKRHKSPFPSIVDELKTLGTRISQELESGDVNLVRMEAICQQHASLIALSRMAADEFGLEDLDSIYKDLGITNASIAEDYLEPHHQAALELIRRSLDQGDSPSRRAGAEAWDGFKSVIMETFKFVTKDNTTLTATAALTWLYVWSSQATTDPQVMNFVYDTMGWEKTEKQEFFDLETGEVLISEVPIEEFTDASFPKVVNDDGSPALCHSHGPQVVHCFFNDRIKDFSYGILEIVERASDTAMNVVTGEEKIRSPYSAFSQSSRETVGPVANSTLYGNILQWVAHLPYFFMMWSRGKAEGVKSYLSTASLFSGLADSVVSLSKLRPLAIPSTVVGTTAAVYLDWGEKLQKAIETSQDMDTFTIVATAILSGVVGNKAWKKSHKAKDALLTLKDDIKKEKSNELQEAMSFAAIESARLSENLPMDIEEVRVGTRIAGLKHSFNVHSQNLQPTLDALNQFDLLLNNIANQMGVHEAWYLEFLKSHVESATTALRNYAQDGDQKALQKVLGQSLAHVMGAQARHMGSAHIYEALSEQDASERMENLLERHGGRQSYSGMLTNHLKHHAKNIFEYKSVVETFRSIENPFKVKPVDYSLSGLSNYVYVQGKSLLRSSFQAVKGAGYHTIEKTKSVIAVGSNVVWRSMVETAKAFQTGYSWRPMNLAVKASGAFSALAVALDLTRLNEQLLSPQAAELVENVSGTVMAPLVTAAMTLAAFAGYNVYDDVIVNDVIYGEGALTVGVAMHYLKWLAAGGIGAAAYKMSKDTNSGVQNTLTP